MVRFTHVLAATDFGESSERAVALALDVAGVYGAKLTIAHAYAIALPASYPVEVAWMPDQMEALRLAAEKRMDELAAELRPRIANLVTVARAGDAATVILELAEELGAQLVVVGTHGHRGLSRILLGSVAEKIVRLSHVPVLTVRGRD